MATPAMTPGFDEAKLNAFMGKAVTDMGAAMHATLVVVGDKLGLYKAMAGAGGLLQRNWRRRPTHPSATCANG